MAPISIDKARFAPAAAFFAAVLEGKKPQISRFRRLFDIVNTEHAAVMFRVPRFKII